MSTSHRSKTPLPVLIGIDLGGTKCAVSVPDESSAGGVREVARFPSGAPDVVLSRIFAEIDKIVANARAKTQVATCLFSFGISCGGPLDAEKGMILSPPNLPGWDRIAICDELTRRYGGRARLMNDANACALAEWQRGAGRGCRDMVFLTMGTGMGAGLVLNGRIYEGASGDAGELGHMRLAPNGPIGFGKEGSFEGFCSGGGIAQLATAQLAAFSGQTTLRAVADSQGGRLTARDVGLAAEKGDTFALTLWDVVGTRLGQALAVVIDFINPQRIVIGGIFPRCERFIVPSMQAEMRREALARNREACRIVPAELGEQIGSHAAIEIARLAFLETQ